MRTPGEWLRGTGPHAEIVMSSRIRLARNLKAYRFPHWATKRELAQVRHNAERAAAQSPHIVTAVTLHLENLSFVDRQMLVERHLISREHAEGQVAERAVVIGDQEMIAVMVNEEDHLRVQVLRSGLSLKEAWAIAEELDEQLERHLVYAFSSQWGYLTCCPTNVGTGVRASAMLHLPCLVMTKQIGRVLHAMTKLGLTARGLYGEGTESTGNFFQISNQVSLGFGEAEIVDKLELLVGQVVEQERNARESVMRGTREALEDRIWRAYGTLKSAHIITSQETTDLLSLVRLGVDVGTLPTLSRSVVNALLVTTQPAHLQKLEGRALASHERDVRRAELLRNQLATSGGE
ncbi:MAG: protein arginine kinase [Candidatus Omnitrophica bacterium]|nr:protein arginine kinase [Candidatus Omnitrophota bacterium]